MYQGINGHGKVVVTATAEEVSILRVNPAYRFLRFVEVKPIKAVEAPAEVQDAPTPKHGNSNSKGRRGRKADGQKP